MGIQIVNTSMKCDGCGATTACRHSGARWLCTLCWPVVFDGTVKADYERTMGPGPREG